MKKNNNQNHGLEGLKDYTEKKSVASEQSDRIRDSDNIKQGWEIKKLGEVCNFQNGFAFQSKSYKESGLPILRITNIQNDEIDTKELVYFDTKDYIVNLDRFKVYQGDLLIAMSGATTGKLGINNSETVFYLNQRVGKFIPKKFLNKSFLYYFLTTKVEESLRIAAGAAQPNLSTEQINNFEIPLPPLPEQQRIVSILDEAFEVIERSRNAAIKNLANAKELFESYLQGVFENGDWEMKTLNQISENLDSKRIPITKNQRKSGSIPYYGASGIVDYVADYIFDEDLLCVSEDGANLLARTYPIAFSISGKTWVNNHAHVLKFQNIITQKFVEVYINSIKIDDYVSGMAQPKLNQAMLNKIPIPFPSLKAQQTIVHQLDALRAETQKLEAVYQKKIDDLEELKKSILQKAFAGELKTEKALAL